MHHESSAAQDKRINPGSSNVFADLGRPNPDELLKKSRLVHEIEGMVRRRRISKAESSLLTCESEADMKAMFRGKIDLYPIKRLRMFLDIANAKPVKTASGRVNAAPTTANGRLSTLGAPGRKPA